MVKHLAPLKAKEQYKYIRKAPKSIPRRDEAKSVSASAPGRFCLFEGFCYKMSRATFAKKKKNGNSNSCQMNYKCGAMLQQVFGWRSENTYHPDPSETLKDKLQKSIQDWNGIFFPGFLKPRHEHNNFRVKAIRDAEITGLSQKDLRLILQGNLKPLLQLLLETGMQKLPKKKFLLSSISFEVIMLV